MLYPNILTQVPFIIILNSITMKTNLYSMWYNQLGMNYFLVKHCKNYLAICGVVNSVCICRLYVNGFRITCSAQTANTMRTSQCITFAFSRGCTEGRWCKELSLVYIAEIQRNIQIFKMYSYTDTQVPYVLTDVHT